MTCEEKEVLAEGLQPEALSHFLAMAVNYEEDTTLDNFLTVVRFYDTKNNLWSFKQDPLPIRQTATEIEIARARSRIARDKYDFMFMTQYMHEPIHAKTHGTPWKVGTIYADLL